MGGVQGLVPFAQMMREIDADNAGELGLGWYWPRECVGVAVDNSADALVIDCTPGPDFGQVGRHMEGEGTLFGFEPGPSAPSIGALLTDVADRLEQGLPFREGMPAWRRHPETPTVVDGRLVWHADWSRPPDIYPTECR
ncbi:hypothetical protein [Spirillospora sp. NPDC047279]|uniref:hypothetical protein n=1 Tax=Spirillospora sp. NPDC047279 TaxID=3155478 RepID=UPI0033EAE1F0